MSDCINPKGPSTYPVVVGLEYIRESRANSTRGETQSRAQERLALWLLGLCSFPFLLIFSLFILFSLHSFLVMPVAFEFYYQFDYQHTQHLSFWHRVSQKCSTDLGLETVGGFLFVHWLLPVWLLFIQIY